MKKNARSHEVIKKTQKNAAPSSFSINHKHTVVLIIIVISIALLMFN